MNINRLNARLYWRETTRSCHPAAGACWTLLLEEMEMQNLGTSRREERKSKRREL